MIKLVSSWTRPGGGTVAHINLTNLLNENGFDCTFYGPHDWHLDKCKSALLQEALLGPEDILISHFIKVPSEVKCKKHILYCHEKDLFPLKEIPLEEYDVIAFVSNGQKKWQGVNHPSVIIPPLVKKVEWTNPNNGVAGVVGSVDRNKQTHLSIERAFKDGFSRVILFGEVNDKEYYDEQVVPVIAKAHYPTLSKSVNSRKFENQGLRSQAENMDSFKGKQEVILAGHLNDPEEMYRNVSAVYHTSLSETYGLVEAECKLSGIPFNGPSNNQEILSEEEILDRWKRILV